MLTLRVRAGLTLSALGLLLSTIISSSCAGRAATAQVEPSVDVAAVYEKIRTMPYTFGSNTDVLHVVAKQAHNREALSGTTDRVEFWVDQQNRKARSVTSRATGSLISELLVLGTRRFEASSPTLTTEYVERGGTDPFLLVVERQLWLYEALLQTGHGRILGTATVSGKPATRAELPTMGQPQLTTIVLLDINTRLPLEIVYQDKSSGQVIASFAWAYEVVEVVPQSQVDPSVFAEPPRERIHTTRRRMTIEQAKLFSSFDIYYAGPDVNGLVPFWIEHEEQHRVLPFARAPQNKVAVTYIVPGQQPAAGSSPRMFVWSERATPADLEEWASVGRRVREGVLQRIAADDFRMELLIGNTLVTVGARTAAEVEQLKKALTRLN